MKRCIIVLWTCLLFYSAKAFSQEEVKSVVAASNMNVLYIGVDNPIHIAVPGYSCEKIYATIENGMITGNNCSFTARVFKQGRNNINIYAIKKKDTILIDQQIFRAKLTPDPTPKLSGMPGGSINSGVLKPQLGIYAESDNFEICAKFKIISFKIKYNRNCTNIADIYNEGTYFNQEVKSLIKSCLPGDQITIYEIHCIGPDGMERVLNPMEFIVV